MGLIVGFKYCIISISSALAWEYYPRRAQSGMK